MKYTKEDYMELIRLVNEFTEGDNSPEAKRLRRTIYVNVKAELLAQFILDVHELLSKKEDPD